MGVFCLSLTWTCIFYGKIFPLWYQWILTHFLHSEIGWFFCLWLVFSLIGCFGLAWVFYAENSHLCSPFFNERIHFSLPHVGFKSNLCLKWLLALIFLCLSWILCCCLFTVLEIPSACHSIVLSLSAHSYSFLSRLPLVAVARFFLSLLFNICSKVFPVSGLMSVVSS